MRRGRGSHKRTDAPPRGALAETDFNAVPEHQGLGRLNNHLRVRIRTWGESRTHEAIREIEWEVDRV